MSELVICPAEGCDYDGMRSSVVAHYSGKQDDAHAGGYYAARDLVDGGDPEPEAKPEAKPNDGPNPTFGAADPTRDPDPDVDDDPDGLELPCGHETVARSDLPELPCNVTCETCGQTWGLRE